MSSARRAPTATVGKSLANADPKEDRMHRISLVASVFLTAALLAPAAMGERPDDRSGVIGVGSVATPAVWPSQSAAVRPDDRPGVRAPGPGHVVASTVLVSSDGFDWDDAGIGVVGGLGFALVAGGVLALTIRRHRVHSLA
jgi:hypothetical protein